jgi:hypothetical protein
MTANDCETHSYEVLDFCARNQKIQKLQITNNYEEKMSQSKIKKTGFNIVFNCQMLAAKGFKPSNQSKSAA